MGTHFARFITFGFIGAIGTFFHYLALILLVELGGLNPVPSTTLGFIVGAITNYYLNYRITFRSSKNHVDALPKFLAIAVITGALNATIVHLGVEWLHYNYLITQILATGLLLLANYALNSAWTFREVSARKSEQGG